MSFEKSGKSEKNGSGLMDEAGDFEVGQALANFRSSVYAWSEAESSRPRTLRAAGLERHRGWRLAAAGALGCVLAAGSVVGGLYDRHHRQEMAKIAAAARAARQRQVAAAERARQEDANLLATVDSDVSQQVPSAMEPLAQLMEPLAQLMDGDAGQ